MTNPSPKTSEGFFFLGHFTPKIGHFCLFCHSKQVRRSPKTYFLPHFCLKGVRWAPLRSHRGQQTPILFLLIIHAILYPRATTRHLNANIALSLAEDVPALVDNIREVALKSSAGARHCHRRALVRYAYLDIAARQDDVNVIGTDKGCF